MAAPQPLIVQIPSGGPLQRALELDPPRSVADGAAVVQEGPTDHLGNLEALPGEVVIALGSPEALVREAAEVSRVLRHAGQGQEPLVVLIEAADELREEELAGLVGAAARTERAVILRVERPG